MTKRAFWFGIAACALALSASGCGGPKSCEEICKALDSCPDVIPSETTCEVRCQQQDKILEAGKCQDAQEAFAECVTKLKDECSANTECPTQVLTRNVCRDDYCTANPMTAGCGDPAN